MGKTLKKFKKQYESDDRRHDIKRRKLAENNKQIRSIDNVLRTKDVNKILSYDN